MKMNYYSLLLIIVIGFFSCKKKDNCEISTSVTYTKDIAPLIEQKCFMCHAPDVYKKKASRVKIFDYKSLVEVAKDGRLLGAINHEVGFVAMPYRKSEKIDECSIKTIEIWINNNLIK